MTVQNLQREITSRLPHDLVTVCTGALISVAVLFDKISSTNNQFHAVDEKIPTCKMAPSGRKALRKYKEIQ